MFVIKVVASLFISFFATYWVVPHIIVLAKKFNILDIPDGSVKKHKEPTPYLGGVAVYLGFIVASAAVLPASATLLHFFLGLTLLLVVGLTDDLMPLSPAQKLLGQVVAALCLVPADFGFTWALSLFWVVTLINAFNLIDVMDGLASLVAIAATATFLGLALLWGQESLALVLGAFLGALCAFFLYNRPPAKIYLGDAGSLFLGGLLGAVPFMLRWPEAVPTFSAIVISVVILAIPLLELASLIVIRTAKRIPFYKPSPDHFSFYLLRAHWPKNFVLIYVACQTAWLAGITFLLVFTKSGVTTPFFAILLFLCSWAFIFMQQK
jgi:UDP-GlcNAc:undecaprenyl-phosphate/decaprenyl-phosphate GlcNAc-1-phosphate transferase